MEHQDGFVLAGFWAELPRQSSGGSGMTLGAEGGGADPVPMEGKGLEVV